MNDTDWASIEDSENDHPYAPERRTVTPPPADTNDFFMGDPPADEPEDDGPPFITARYDGPCSACEEYHITAGETRIRADGSGGWEAEGCAW
jgi:hypothetical protein